MGLVLLALITVLVVKFTMDSIETYKYRKMDAMNSVVLTPRERLANVGGNRHALPLHEIDGIMTPDEWVALSPLTRGTIFEINPQNKPKQTKRLYKDKKSGKI